MSDQVMGIDLALLGRQLRRARETLALSPREAAEAAALGPTGPADLVRWEKGEVEPPLDALWQLADLYARSTDYFLRDLPARPSRIRFRVSLPGRGPRRLSVQARRALAEFEELCRKRHELEGMLGKEPTVRVPRGLGVSDPDATATDARRALGLDGGPIRDLRATLENAGVRVFEVPVEESQFAGFSWWHPQYGPCIMLNARDSAGRKNFTMAHEYAHLITDTAPSVCDLKGDQPPERFADRFAAALLIPRADLEEQWGKRGYAEDVLGLSEAGVLARRYATSLEAVVRRLAEVGLVGTQKRDSLIQVLAARPSYRRRGRSPAWRRRLGERYVSLADQAYRGRHISLGRLADLLGISVVKAADFAASNAQAKGNAT